MPQAILSKANAEKYAIGLRYNAPDLESTETISTVTVAITPTGVGALVADGSPTISGNIVSQVVKDGVAGTDYTVLFKVTTSTGKIFNHPDRDAILVRVV